MLPEDQCEKMRNLWEEFEAMETPEAKFARTLDNVQPTMLNAASGGKGWMEHNVSLSQIMKRQSYTPDGSQTLWEYAWDHFFRPNIEEGRIHNDLK